MSENAEKTPNLENTETLPNRWLIAIMGTLLQLCLGTVYAWSSFQDLLVKEYGWTNVAVAWTFSFAIFFLGVSAAVGGKILPKVGPRKLAMIGGFCFGLGYLIAAVAMNIKSIPLLYLGYGVIGGIGLGLGYVTPVATVAKWFPDRKGFATGMVVMGFGLGALLMSKVLVPICMSLTGGNIATSFAYIGLFFLVVAMTAGSFLVNPPAGYLPQGYTPPAASATTTTKESGYKTAKESVCSAQFILMWIIFCCNIAAGIAIIGFQSPLFQSLWKSAYPFSPDRTLTPEQIKEAAIAFDKLVAGYGATLVAFSAIFNGLGRFFWASVSDKIGRLMTFRILLSTQIIAFAVLTQIQNPWVFGAIVCYILLCYGGGFGTMPSFVLDVFGSKLMAIVYGIILTAWSVAGIAGPQLFAYIKDNFAETISKAGFYTYIKDIAPNTSSFSFLVASIFLVVGFIVTLILRKEKVQA